MSDSEEGATAFAQASEKKTISKEEAKRVARNEYMRKYNAKKRANKKKVVKDKVKKVKLVKESTALECNCEKELVQNMKVAIYCLSIALVAAIVLLVIVK